VAWVPPLRISPLAKINWTRLATGGEADPPGDAPAWPPRKVLVV